MINILDVANHEYKATISPGAVGDAVYVHPVANRVRNYFGPVSVTIIPAAEGSAKAQLTTSPKAQIIAGTAVWSDWAKGVVTVITRDYIAAPVTGVRGAHVTGDACDVEVVM